MTAYLRRNGGYTLIEVILVVLILGIAIPPIFYLLTYNSTSSVDSEIYTRATLFAQEKMEEILADKRGGFAGRGYDYITTPARYSADAPASGYTRTVSIVENTSAGIEHAEITVRVSHDMIEDVVLVAWVTDYD